MARTVLMFRESGLEKARLEKAAAEQSKQAEQQRLAAEDERRRNTEAQAAAAQEQAHAVKALADGLGRMSDDDLTVHLNEGFTEAYQHIKNDFNTTIDRLKETIGAIAASTGHITSASADISTSTTDLSQRTEEQAASLEETSASARHRNRSRGGGVLAFLSPSHQSPAAAGRRSYHGFLPELRSATRPRKERSALYGQVAKCGHSGVTGPKIEWKSFQEIPQ
jgi:hypothetical protein